MKIKNLSVAVLFIGILSVLGFGSLILPDHDISVSERRHLTGFASYAQKRQEAEDKGREYGPTDYFSFLETYSLDQFPARDLFRGIKSVFKQKILLQKDNNGYYSVGGDLSKLDPELNEKALSDSIGRINSLYEKYFEPLGANAYYCVIPDKNYFLAEENGYLHYDYDKFYQTVADTVNGDIREIGIRPLLSAESYYRTDPHWDQRKLLPVAEAILQDMGAAGGVTALDWQTHSLESFRGTYLGQSALPVPPDTLSYLTSSRLDNVSVYDYAAKAAVPLYQEENFGNVDPYDVFLGGAVPLLKIENPNGTTDKQLVIFRDSFGSSIVPLLSADYSEIIVADIRYISPASLSTMVRFRPGCDVLFAYSTSVLNTYGVFMN